MQQLYEPQSGILTVRYAPDGGEAGENPPRFSWLPANDANGPYLLEISRSETFENPELRYADLPLNFFAPDKALAPGHWYWRYALAAPEGALYSRVRQFDVTAQAPVTPLPLRGARFAHASNAHPRLWLSPEGAANFRAKLKKDPAWCGFDVFYEKAVRPALNAPFPAEPKPYPDNRRVIALWRQSYQTCQDAFNALRFLCVAGVVLEDGAILQKAVDAAVSMAAWDIHGPTGRDYNDECAFRVAGALAWGYDWLYDVFAPDQRAAVRAALTARTAEIAHHALVDSKIHYSLYDSHAVRSLSSVLIPCGIALLHEEAQAEEWLQYAVDYLNVLYTPWGGAQGGWSEGGMYWTTGMAYLIEALNLLKNYAGLDLFCRPFFQHTADFPLYCWAHDTSRASFCDQSNLGDKPILKTGFNAREFAGVTGNGLYQWYFEQIAKRESYDDTRFFNTGWWNFYFDELVYRANYKNVKPVAPAPGRCVKWFSDIGWVAMHANMGCAKEHIALLFKSSPYGSVSHSHADQNDIVLHAYGDALLIESGYYIGFNSSMHRDWRRQTKSTNSLLVDGRGQYAGMDKTRQLAATGKILGVWETPDYVKTTGDASQAYRETVPELRKYLRTVYFVDDCYFVLVDEVECAERLPVSFLLHSLYRPEWSNGQLELAGDSAELTATFVYTSSGTAGTQLTDRYDGVKETELVGLENQWHFALQTNPARRHVLVTCLFPRKKDRYDAVETIKDDQGHDVYLYFTHNGKTFSLCVDGNARY